MTDATQQLRVSLLCGRLDIVIDRPQARNALSISTLEQIAGIFSDHASSPDIKVAVLTGAGDKAFAAGGDLKELSNRRSADDADALFTLGSGATEAVRRFPVPVVCALNGVALGGGAELAVACDFRLAAPSARIGFVQAQLGLTTGFGGCPDLQNLVGARMAMLLLLNGEILAAEEARRIGLIDQVAEEGATLDDLVGRFIEPILKRPADLVRGLKAVALSAEDASGRSAVARVERERFIRAWTSDEHWAASDKVLARGK